MTLKDYIFTSESVSEGHPDKVCDQISDAILDAFIANDIKLGHADDSHANTRLGCETLATTNKIVIAGEGRASAPYMRKYGKHTIVNREALTEIARNVVRDIGYDQDGFSFHGADVEVLLHGQSPDIAMGVDAKKKGGNLGDQEGGRPGPDVRLRLPRQRGIREGLVHAGPDLFLAQDPRGLSKARRSGELPDLQPDAKSQVTVRYVDGKAVGATKVVVSTQHRETRPRARNTTPA